MKRILINAAQPSEIRIAYVDNGALTDFEIESQAQESIRGNVYAGVVSSVNDDLEAAFVDIGVERHGLLSFRNSSANQDTESNGTESETKLTLGSLKVGQTILIQVNREARGDKGPSLTTDFSLPGRFVVLKPNSSITTVSRSVSEEQRTRLRTLGNNLPKIENMGWIMRTTSTRHSQEEVTGDFHRMVNLWRNIQRAFDSNQYQAPALVYSDNTLMQRVLRDRLRRDGTKVIIDDPKLYRDARSFASDIMPELRDQIELYRGTRPMFESFRVEAQVRSTFQREVSLPSGGVVVFDPTEALLSIDVNSARNTKGDNLEDTALNTNLEAAREICRQLLIRNIGGLVIVDFIDMLTPGYNEQVEAVVEECLARDPVKTGSTKISELGLMQMNRQRRRPSIYDTHFVECPHCHGARFLPRVETISNQILRALNYQLHNPAKTENQYLVRVSQDVAGYILNKERLQLHELEINTRKQIVFIADPTLSGDMFHIHTRRVKALDYEGGSNLEELLEETKLETTERQRKALPEEPRETPRPMVSPLGHESRKKKGKKTVKAKAKSNQGQRKDTAKKKQKGLFGKLFGIFSSDETKSKKSRDKQQAKAKQPQKNKQQRKSPKGQAKVRDRNQVDTVQRDKSARKPRPSTPQAAKDSRGNRRPATNERATQTNRTPQRANRPQSQQRQTDRPVEARGKSARTQVQAEDRTVDGKPNRRMPRANRSAGGNSNRNQGQENNPRRRQPNPSTESVDTRPQRSSATGNQPRPARAASEASSSGGEGMSATRTARQPRKSRETNMPQQVGPQVSAEVSGTDLQAHRSASAAEQTTKTNSSSASDSSFATNDPRASQRQNSRAGNSRTETERRQLQEAPSARQAANNESSTEEKSASPNEQPVAKKDASESRSQEMKPEPATGNQPPVNELKKAPLTDDAKPSESSSKPAQGSRAGNDPRHRPVAP